MKTQTVAKRLLALFAAILWSCTAHALSPSNMPLYLNGSVEPNVMFTLDDSGSMQWEMMPDEFIFWNVGVTPANYTWVNTSTIGLAGDACGGGHCNWHASNSGYVLWTFPRIQNIYGTSNYGRWYANVASVVGMNLTDVTGNAYTALARAPQTNTLFYNPAITYKPWSNADGTLFANALPSCAPHNPSNLALGCRNLTPAEPLIPIRERWANCAATSYATNSCERTFDEQTFWPATYFYHNGGDIWNWNNYTRVFIRAASSATYTGHGRGKRTDCADAANATCTYAEEIQNFANWYTYYRSRILLARAGVGQAFAQQGDNMRVGFATINQAANTIDSVSSPGTVISGVRKFSGANRTSFFTSLYNHPIPAAGTPLRRAIDQVGQYFQRTDDNGPWGEFPGTGGGTQLTCRQNYNILMTDGYWEDSGGNSAAETLAARANVDNTAGATITGKVSGIATSYTYAPDFPFKDSWGDPTPLGGTLADVALYYWKRDLRPDFVYQNGDPKNDVPTSTANPAFWQHLVNFTVGLGVTGTLDPAADWAGLVAGTTSWPMPCAGCGPVNIDDLWHAAVNSRGGFFSASDPETFANALSTSLQEIVNRTSSSSSVATSTTELKTGSKYFQSLSTSAEWSGTLVSKLIANNALQWDAGEQLKTQLYASTDTRTIITRSSGVGGVPFLYGNLTGAQQTHLNKDENGVVDGRGADRVGYLRGHSHHEGTSTGTFRQRPNRKLGDIVHSNPWFVGEPAAGHSDVDYANYSAFRTSYLERFPVVYVGANDGMLHGFNACEIGQSYAGVPCTAAIAGTELIAYVPSVVYPNLSKLTGQNYNNTHLFTVDGSPMVGDAVVNNGTTTSWRSVLVSGLNSGGKAYFALDVTNPADTSKAAPTFAEGNANSLLLWEFTDGDDADLGLTYNLPPIIQETGQPQQIVRMANGKWAAIVGNGYNSSAGKSALFILFLDRPSGGAWTLGTDYVKLVADTSGANGLSTPFPFDSNGDGTVDVVYAGDLKGKMWKFLVGPNGSDASVTTDPATWKVAFAGNPLFTTPANQPITTPPVVSLHPTSGLMVLFGTGKYIETADVTSSFTQTFYGIRDIGVAVTGKPSLTQQVLNNTLPRLVTSTVAPVTPQLDAANNPLSLGWYADLPLTRERITGRAFIENKLVFFDTIVPNTDVCEGGVSSQITVLQYDTGAMPTISVFGDIDGDGVDDIVAGIATGQALSGTTFIKSSGTGTGTGGYKGLSSQLQGTVTDFDVDVGGGVRGRITWREIVQ